MTAAALRSSPPSAEAVRAHMLEALRRGERHERPFRHWLISDLLPAATAEAAAGLPFAPPPDAVFSGRRETNNATRRYFAGATLAEHPVAAAVARAFQAPETVQAIGAISGADLAGSCLRIEYCVDTDGFWLEPHTDIGAKRLTLLIYLSRGKGASDWGTDVYSDPDTLFGTVEGRFDAALLFVPGADTYHGFRRRPIAGVRRTLIVNYVGPEWRARHELAFPETPVG